MSKFTLLLFLACTPSFGVLITGGYFDIPTAFNHTTGFELKSESFDVVGSYYNYDTYDAGNTLIPYASGPFVESPDLGIGSGTVNGVYYSTLYLNAPPGDFLTGLSGINSGSTSFNITGPTVYGNTITVSAPFTINTKFFSLFLLSLDPQNSMYQIPTCLECNISLQASGTVTYDWQYNQANGYYYTPNILFSFTAPPDLSTTALAATPEPSTWLLFAGGLVALLGISGDKVKLIWRAETSAPKCVKHPKK